jgi:hypothetical protein
MCSHFSFRSEPIVHPATNAVVASEMLRREATVLIAGTIFEPVSISVIAGVSSVGSGLVGMVGATGAIYVLTFCITS